MWPELISRLPNGMMRILEFMRTMCVIEEVSQLPAMDRTTNAALLRQGVSLLRGVRRSDVLSTEGGGHEYTKNGTENSSVELALLDNPEK